MFPMRNDLRVRPALPRDAVAIRDLVDPYANHERHILIPKDLIGYYEAILEFFIAEELVDGRWLPVGCGALHVFWEDLAEVRTLAVREDRAGHGIGHAIVERLLERARELEVKRVFCLTFEVEFFQRHGFREIAGSVVAPEVFSEMLRSYDSGVAEFLDLARVKPNTLGNTRMLVEL